MPNTPTTHVLDGQPVSPCGDTVAAIYTRSDVMDEDTHEDVLRSVCIKRGWTVHGVYEDRGLVGTRRYEWLDPDGTSSGLGRLLQDGFHRPYGIVLVWRLSRLMASTLGFMDLRDELDYMGVGLVSYMEDMDWSTPQGRAFFGILAGMAEFERSQYGEYGVRE